MKKLITILLLLALLLTPTAAMAKVYLVVATLANTGVSSFTFDYHEVEEMDLCTNCADAERDGVVLIAWRSADSGERVSVLTTWLQPSEPFY